jgi:retinol dehydrogenase-12
MADMSDLPADAGDDDGGAGDHDGLRGRTFLVTGGNTGIGLSTACELARRGGRVFIGCRSMAAGEAAVAAIKSAAGSRDVWLLPLDLSSLTAVRACAAAFLSRGEPLHVLVNNAGLGGQRGLTVDGFELHFGVNHLGHYALTLLLLDRLIASGPDARIVNVSSAAHYGATGIDFDALRRRTASFTGQREYAVSKLCNVLFTQELTRRLAGSDVSASALHPGVVASDIWRRVPRLVRPLIKARMLTTEQGAVTSLYCATSPAVPADGGRYYDQCAVQEPNPVATPELAERLWQRSATWAGVG